jgi:hypothetical protein
MLTLNVQHGNPIVLETLVVRVNPSTQQKFDIGVEFKNLMPNDEYLLNLQLQKKIADSL